MTRESVTEALQLRPPELDSGRDLTFERMFTAEAGASVRMPVEELIVFSERRSPGPIRDLPTRDFGREVLEELADSRNYLGWMAQQAYLSPTPDAELVALIAEALQGTIVTFTKAHAARLRWVG